mmetsp:Transcript_51244/g.151057  ORF Transcript_51244/g.151057 Transcript_51244/m.151057 type:complete len:276 (-) Transcript_51244:339-1166(-)
MHSCMRALAARLAALSVRCSSYSLSSVQSHSATSGGAVPDASSTRSSIAGLAVLPERCSMLRMLSSFWWNGSSASSQTALAASSAALARSASDSHCMYASASASISTRPRASWPVRNARRRRPPGCSASVPSGRSTLVSDSVHATTVSTCRELVSCTQSGIGVPPNWRAGKAPNWSEPSEKRPCTARWMHACASTVTATSNASGDGPPKSSLWSGRSSCWLPSSNWSVWTDGCLGSIGRGANRLARSLTYGESRLAWLDRASAGSQRNSTSGSLS